MVRGSRRFSYCGITTARADALSAAGVSDLFGSGVENSSMLPVRLSSSRAYWWVMPCLATKY